MAPPGDRRPRGKRYCKTCKCWVQGDKASISRHELSDGHKNKIARMLKRARDQISQGSVKRTSTKKFAREADAASDEEMDAFEVLGQYCVDGVVYLQGDMHRDVLDHACARPDKRIRCEMFDESADEWVEIKTIKKHASSSKYVCDGAMLNAEEVRIVAPAPPAFVEEEDDPKDVVVDSSDDEEDLKYYKGFEL